MDIAVELNKKLTLELEVKLKRYFSNNSNITVSSDELLKDRPNIFPWVYDDEEGYEKYNRISKLLPDSRYILDVLKNDEGIWILPVAENLYFCFNFFNNIKELKSSKQVIIWVKKELENMTGEEE